MKGLMIKDLYVMKDGMIIPLLLLDVLGVVMSFLASPWILISIAACSVSMQVTMTIPTDKSSQWYKFSATLPVSRTQFIKSKYLMYVMFSVLGVLLGSVIAVALTMVKGDFRIDALPLNIIMAVIISLLPGSVNIPCAFLFDEEKSIVGVIISYLVTAGIFVGIKIILDHFMDTNVDMLFTYGIIAVFSVAIYLLSWALYPKAVSPKDL